ncbi:class I adenylate-forming enzyme family protein [Rhodococcus sp. NPDC057529]|uniref:class I adenylate-forming enzyme family protein n=1 Tax=Rhodococcus sp. NPDC057529 TaxID=3346158 RepID=UPI00366D97D7
MTSDELLNGLPRSLRYPQVGMDSMLAGVAASYGNRIALMDGDDHLTFRELQDNALRIATWLRRRGVDHGDRVAIAMPNNLRFAGVYLGTILAGATACVVNPLTPTATLAEQFEDFDPIALFIHPTSESALEARTSRMELVVRVPGTHTSGRGAAGRPDSAVPLADLLAVQPQPLPACHPDTVAHLQLTGGTTGNSKGVLITHRNILANMIQLAAHRSGALAALDGNDTMRLELREGAQHRYSDIPGTGVALHLAPVFHGAGLMGLLSYIFTGTTTVLLGRFQPESFVDAIERHQVTKAGGVPAMFHALLDLPHLHTRDVSSVLTISFGAAPIDTTTLKQLYDVFSNARVCEGYGLSEATCHLTLQPVEPDRLSPIGSVGLPLPDTEIEIRDATGKPLPPCATGEIWARGPQVASGYHNAPEKTAEQFVNGWLRTGDLGHFDEGGNLFIDGRAKEMLIYKGYNIYPNHLEELLAMHPAVAQCTVVGADRPGVGQIPFAFVVAAGGYEVGAALTEELMQFVSARVAPHQRIREIRFVTTFPMSPVGKILKRELVQHTAQPENS